jgi:hypothetical protein
MQQIFPVFASHLAALQRGSKKIGVEVLTRQRKMAADGSGGAGLVDKHQPFAHILARTWSTWTAMEEIA